MESDIEDLITEMQQIVKKMIKPSRYEHSVRTAETAELLCDRNGVYGRVGYYAGIVHDMCKEFTDKEILAIVKEDGEPVSELENENKNLMHGRAAAVLLQKNFGETDESVLEAVRNHTFGMPGMCDLAKILYAADKIEPGRPHMSPELYDELVEKPLDDLVIRVLQDNIRYLNENGRGVAPVSETFLYSLIRDKQKNRH